MDVVRVIAIGRDPRRAQHLVADDLGKAENGIQRGLQFMAHGGQESRLHAVGDLGLAKGGPQGAILLELLGDILHRAFIANQLPRPVAYRAGIFRDPEAAARAMTDFGNKMGRHVIGLYQGAEFVAPAGMDIELGADVSQARDQFFGVAIAIDVAQRLIDGEIAAIRRGAEDAVHRMIEKGAITGFARGDAPAGIGRHALQQSEDATQGAQDDETGNEFAAQIGGKAQPHCETADKQGERRSKSWPPSAVGKEWINQGRHDKAGNAAVPSALLAEKPKCAVELNWRYRAQRRSFCSLLVNLAGKAVKAAAKTRLVTWKFRPSPVRARSKSGALSQSGLCV